MTRLVLAAIITASFAAPATPPSPGRIVRHIIYGYAPDHTRRDESIELDADAFIPNGRGPFPVAVLVHGGAWFQGDKATSFRPILQPLEDAGFAWFSINYRLAPQAYGIGPVHDVQQAVRFVKEHAPAYKFDPDRVVLIGESAGAHLASLAALQATPDTSVRGVVSFYGPENLADLAQSLKVPEQLDQLRQGMQGTALGNLANELFQKYSPLHYIHAGMPPFLFIHGTADQIVPFRESEDMCDAMRKAQGSCIVVPVPRGIHGMSHWEGVTDTATYKRKLVNWLEQNISAPVDRSRY